MTTKKHKWELLNYIYKHSIPQLLLCYSRLLLTPMHHQVAAIVLWLHQQDLSWTVPASAVPMTTSLFAAHWQCLLFCQNRCHLVCCEFDSPFPTNSHIMKLYTAYIRKRLPISNPWIGVGEWCLTVVNQPDRCCKIRPNSWNIHTAVCDEFWAAARPFECVGRMDNTYPLSDLDKLSCHIWWLGFCMGMMFQKLGYWGSCPLGGGAVEP